MTFSRYPDNWSEIALRIKQKQDWNWIKCGRRCLRPGEDRSKTEQIGNDGENPTGTPC